MHQERDSSRTSAVSEADLVSFARTVAACVACNGQLADIADHLSNPLLRYCLRDAATRSSPTPLGDVLIETLPLPPPYNHTIQIHEGISRASLVNYLLRIASRHYTGSLSWS
jgi:hypothetical protein